MKILSQINKLLPYFKKSTNQKIFKNILVVSNTGLGDTILSTPAIISLRRSFPEIHITFLIHKKIFSLFKGFEFVDEFIIYSPGILNQLKIINQLRKKEVDTIFLFHSNGPEDIFFSILSRAKNILKMTDNDNHNFRNIFLNSPNIKSQHDIEKKLDLVRIFNPSIITKKMLIPEHFYRNSVFIQKKPNFKYIGIQMGAQEEYKMWPTNNFIKLADMLNSSFNYIKFVLIGKTSIEKKISEKFEGAIENKGSVVNLCGKSTIDELPLILNDLDLLLTNDTGALHLSVALGINTVSLFGPTNAQEFGPYQDLEKHKILKVKNGKFVKDREKKFRLLNKIDNINVVSVYEVIAKWLKN